MIPSEAVTSFLEELSLSDTESVTTNLESYVQLLREWNEKINLVSRKDIGRVWDRHILDSLSCLPHLDFKGKKVLDFGCGGGLPGVPVKICAGPDVDITFMDRTRKKVTALQDIIDRLSLERASAVWGNGEELAQTDEHAEVYDIVLTRAVGSLAKAVSAVHGLIGFQGLLVMWQMLDTPTDIPHPYDMAYPVIRRVQTGSTPDDRPVGLIFLGREGSERHFTNENALLSG